MSRAGLRTRLTAGFAAGAFVLSGSMAALSYQFTRNSLLAERERTAIRAAYFEATVVRAELDAQQPRIIDTLRSLNTGENRRTLLNRNGAWYARNADSGLTSAIPGPLQDLVAAGEAGVQRIETDGTPAVVVGVPLSPTTSFYHVDSLEELDHTLRVLALVLSMVAITTAGAGAGFGWYAARHALRPLASVAGAAQEIIAGDLNARLNPATEPDLRQLTSSFNQMVDQLAERMRRDRRFAADVSHELRSPLQTLAAAASLLERRREHLDERTATAARLVAEEVHRFQRLVHDLLELARGDLSVERQEINAPALARQVCRSRGLSEALVRSSGTSRWWVDPRRLRQVIGNLLDNAHAYGGGPCAVHLRAGDGRYVVEVDDEGPGVDPVDRENIFLPFVRGRSANSRGASDGTGLGLALVVQHASAHSGRAAVQDRPGGGARFRVELEEPRR
ncbi:HAMP domain-containing sensor histidine kinase [Micromonospora sp. WMMD1102]|uniref:sensor histidine kinase n=1 Tax=Micromonospora sp. WMMD1102 TaxID=3016105 RepID=UPI00241578BF|nr:HAMP domain-containing sensor histidine kinase [Micromonospora sp. WMMD1102]MDG4787831.1 HAMP domain-containing sensor histidine kinase [Micromonospora sp. WMMD1102]